MPSTHSTTHRFDHGPTPPYPGHPATKGDALFGIDSIPFSIPLLSRFTGVVLVTEASNGGRAQVVGQPGVGSTESQTLEVSWELAPAPGSFITYHCDISLDALPRFNGMCIVFEHRDFQGRPLFVNDRINFADLNAKGWNDIISSIVILRGTWTFFSDDLMTPYRDSAGHPKQLPPGLYPWVEDVQIKNDDISSFMATG